MRRVMKILMVGMEIKMVVGGVVDVEGVRVYGMGEEEGGRGI